MVVLRFALLVTAASCTILPAYAEDCLKIGGGSAFAGNLLSYIEKEPGKTLVQTAAEARSDFKRVPDPFASFGYTQKNFVLRIPVCPPTQGEHVFVQLQGLYPEAAALFWPAICEKKGICNSETGKRVAYDRNAVFEFSTLNTQGYLYLDAVPPGSRRYPVFIHTAGDFFSVEKKYLWAAGLFFGALLTIFIYNLALYLGLKERINLYYSVYLLFFIALFLSFERVFEIFAGHSGNPVYLFFRSGLFPLMLVPFALFNMEFMASVSGRYQRYAWWLLIAGDALLFSANFFVDYLRIMPVNIVVAVIHCTVALFFIVRGIFRGFRPAWLMFLGWLFFLTSAILSSLHLLGKFSIAYNDYLTHMMKFGSVAENLLFTVALAVRVRFYKRRAERFGAELAAEREILARDLHDVLGSEFGQMQMQLSRADVPADIARWLGQKSRSMNGRVRDIIFLLRSDLTQETIHEELQAHLDILRGLDHFIIEERIDAAALECNAFLLLDALRILQEWTGNCLRHGKPSRMAVRLDRRAYGLRLCVQSDGTPFAWRGERRSEGLGLSGIRARTAQRVGFARCRAGSGGNIFIAILRETQRR